MTWLVQAAAAVAPAQEMASFASAPAFADAPDDAAPGAFATLMRGLDGVGGELDAAESAMAAVAAGKPVALHEAMISLERASIDVQTFIQVRNKLVESFQDLMRMQM